MKHYVKWLLPMLLVVCNTVSAAADRSEIRAELFKILTDLSRPITQAAEETKSWHLKIQGDVMGKKGEIEMAWDNHANHFLRFDVEGMPKASAAFGNQVSWLHIPGKNVLFKAAHPVPEGETLLNAVTNWDTLTSQIPVLFAAFVFVPIPEEVKLEKNANGAILIDDGDDLRLEVTPKNSENYLAIKSLSEKVPGSIAIKSWEQVPTKEIQGLYRLPKAERVEEVDVAHLRGMLTTFADFASERILQEHNPDFVTDPLADAPKVDGVAVVKFKGTPEEMGAQHGALLKEAIHYNMNRTLHGVGLYATIETGKWFPGELAKAWKAEEQFIPPRFIAEIDAMSDAAGIPREWGRSVNVFPELFHCSGLALKGKATVDGRLYHGRVLDYMTDIGLQRTAAVLVFQPKEGNAWTSMGYAGLCSTVTAMNEKGLAMGEMGGRGEGYHDGIPMSLMMREVMERFDNSQDALDWMKSVPRTCEYFYVISDSKTKTMAGIASMSKKLADERGQSDFKVIRPNEFDDRLPHPMEDAVLMSADKRYEKLAERVKENYGKLDMQGAWDLMKGGVAMKSNLHTVLFAPESLDFWAAQAGPEGEPAYTQKISKLNLKALLAEETKTQTSDSQGASK